MDNILCAYWVEGFKRSRIQVKDTQTAITFPSFLRYLIQFFDFNRHFLKYFFAADNGRAMKGINLRAMDSI
jgi:hypothetical protein